VKRRYWSLTREAKALLDLPRAALAERRLRNGRSHGSDVGPERVLFEVMRWLCRAQDSSKYGDGGVARDFCLIRGWAASYPETTGYIVPTFLAYANRTGETEYRDRARRMIEWLVSIQLADGAFQGGKIDARPLVPVTFNTGQILLGLAAGAEVFGSYRQTMRRAADWLIATQDADGCWRRYPSPFAAPGEKVYETHVAWGLFEAARIDPDRGYAEAAIANVRWAISSQRPNGWLERCCLDSPSAPLTHTLGYALRGIIEAYRYTADGDFLAVARRTADGLLGAFGADGYLPGRLRADWSSQTSSVCLTGTAQIAHCLLLLGELTNEARYAECGRRANAFVRRTVNVDGAPEVRGGVRGSQPFHGPYGRFQYLNWAAKFLADSLMLELDLQAGRRLRSHLAADREEPTAGVIPDPLAPSRRCDRG
jgi:hypothetical protein